MPKQRPHNQHQHTTLRLHHTHSPQPRSRLQPRTLQKLRNLLRRTLRHHTFHTSRRQKLQHNNQHSNSHTFQNQTLSPSTTLKSTNQNQNKTHHLPLQPNHTNPMQIRIRQLLQLIHQTHGTHTNKQNKSQQYNISTSSPTTHTQGPTTHTTSSRPIRRQNSLTKNHTRNQPQQPSRRPHPLPIINQHTTKSHHHHQSQLTRKNHLQRPPRPRQSRRHTIRNSPTTNHKQKHQKSPPHQPLQNHVTLPNTTQINKPTQQA